MKMKNHVLLVLPPRSHGTVLPHRVSAGETPIPELCRLANELLALGYQVSVLNADLLSDDAFQCRLLSASRDHEVLAFLLRVYRIPAARRAVRKLRIQGVRTQSVAFGFLSQRLEDVRELSDEFDVVLVGPGWTNDISEQLLRWGVRPKEEALAPQFVWIGEFPALTGRPGATGVIEAPSGGCVYACTFCEHQIHKGSGAASRARWLPRRLRAVICEMRLAQKKGARNFVFLESNFLSYPDWTNEFAMAVSEGFPGASFGISTRLDDMDLNDSNGNLDALQEAGLFAVNSGLESGSNAILSRVRKGVLVDQYFAGDAILRRRGIRRHYNIVLGLPGETEETIAETVQLIEHLDPDGVQVSIAVPLPGTPFWEEANAAGWITSRSFTDYYYYKSCVVRQGALTPDRLVALQETLDKRLNEHTSECQTAQ